MMSLKVKSPSKKNEIEEKSKKYSAMNSHLLYDLPKMTLLKTSVIYEYMSEISASFLKLIETYYGACVIDVLLRYVKSKNDKYQFFSCERLVLKKRVFLDPLYEIKLLKAEKTNKAISLKREIGDVKNDLSKLFGKSKVYEKLGNNSCEGEFCGYTIPKHFKSLKITRDKGNNNFIEKDSIINQDTLLNKKKENLQKKMSLFLIKKIYDNPILVNMVLKSYKIFPKDIDRILLKMKEQYLEKENIAKQKEEEIRKRNVKNTNVIGTISSFESSIETIETQQKLTLPNINNNVRFLDNKKTKSNNEIALYVPTENKFRHINSDKLYSEVKICENCYIIYLLLENFMKNINETKSNFIDIEKAKQTLLILEKNETIDELENPNIQYLYKQDESNFNLKKMLKNQIKKEKSNLNRSKVRDRVESIQISGNLYDYKMNLNHKVLNFNLLSESKSNQFFKILYDQINSTNDEIFKYFNIKPCKIMFGKSMISLRMHMGINSSSENSNTKNQTDQMNEIIKRVKSDDKHSILVTNRDLFILYKAFKKQKVTNSRGGQSSFFVLQKSKDSDRDKNDYNQSNLRNNSIQNKLKMKINKNKNDDGDDHIINKNSDRTDSIIMEDKSEKSLDDINKQSDDNFNSSINQSNKDDISDSDRKIINKNNPVDNNDENSDIINNSEKEMNDGNESENENLDENNNKDNNNEDIEHSIQNDFEKSDNNDELNDNNSKNDKNEGKAVKFKKSDNLSVSSKSSDSHNFANNLKDKIAQIENRKSKFSVKTYENALNFMDVLDEENAKLLQLKLINNDVKKISVKSIFYYDWNNDSSNSIPYYYTTSPLTILSELNVPVLDNPLEKTQEISLEDYFKICFTLNLNSNSNNNSNKGMSASKNNSTLELNNIQQLVNDSIEIPQNLKNCSVYVYDQFTAVPYKVSEIYNRKESIRIKNKKNKEKARENTNFSNEEKNITKEEYLKTIKSNLTDEKSKSNKSDSNKVSITNESEQKIDSKDNKSNKLKDENIEKKNLDDETDKYIEDPNGIKLIFIHINDFFDSFSQTSYLLENSLIKSIREYVLTNFGEDIIEENDLQKEKDSDKPKIEIIKSICFNLPGQPYTVFRKSEGLHIMNNIYYADFIDKFLYYLNKNSIFDSSYKVILIGFGNGGQIALTFASLYEKFWGLLFSIVLFNSYIENDEFLNKSMVEIYKIIESSNDAKIVDFFVRSITVNPSKLVDKQEEYNKYDENTNLKEINIDQSNNKSKKNIQSSSMNIITNVNFDICSLQGFLSITKGYFYNLDINLDDIQTPIFCIHSNQNCFITINNLNKYFSYLQAQSYIHNSNFNFNNEITKLNKKSCEFSELLLSEEKRQTKKLLIIDGSHDIFSEDEDYYSNILEYYSYFLFDNFSEINKIGSL